MPDESFNDLLGWAERESRKKKSSRLPDSLKFIPEHKSWFRELRDIRNKLVHNHFDLNIYTDAVAPSYATMSTGDIHLQFLRQPRQPLKKRLNLLPLLPFFKRATQGALDLAAQAAEVVATRRGHIPSKTHVINGVYIPALPHLLAYEEPIRDPTEEENHRRKLKARHLWVAGDYLNAVKLGHSDGFWLPFAVRIEELFGVAPIHIGEPRHPRYRDGEALYDWHFYFEWQGRVYVVLLRDGIYYSKEGLEKSRTDFEAFRETIGNASVVVVSDVTRAPREIPVEEIFDGLLLDKDPIQAAERAYAALVAS